VSELQAGLGVESSNVSQQLAILRNSNLVVARRESAKVIYTVKDTRYLIYLMMQERFSTGIQLTAEHC